MRVFFSHLWKKVVVIRDEEKKKKKKKEKKRKQQKQITKKIKNQTKSNYQKLIPGTLTSR